MKIITTNKEEFPVEIIMDNEDFEKDAEDIMFDCASMCACICSEFIKKAFHPENLKDEKQGTLAILDMAQKMAEIFYEDMEKQMESREEAGRMYSYMESFYKEFLYYLPYSEEDILNTVKENETDIDVNVTEDGWAEFGIVDKTTREMLLMIDSCAIKNFEPDKPIREAIKANAVAVIIYDKAFGEDSDKNEARKYSQLYFDEKLKEMCGKG